jgi:AcrR family transcriptional regulator
VLTDEAVGAFRERLIDAAERLFARDGLAAVTMRLLAAELGVSPMTPYRYFADKEAILAAVRARGFERHADALNAAFDAAGPDPAAAMMATGRAYVAFAFAHPEAYKLMFDITQPNEATYPELVAAGDRSRRTMTRGLDALAAAGRFGGDPGLVGHMFWAALHGPIMLAFSGKLESGYGATRIIEGLMDALQRGIFGTDLS